MSWGTFYALLASHAQFDSLETAWLQKSYESVTRYPWIKVPLTQVVTTLDRKSGTSGTGVERSMDRDKRAKSKSYKTSSNTIEVFFWNLNWTGKFGKFV